MLSDFLKSHITSQAAFITSNTSTSYGYGQVEPNHLSAQRTAQVYAQLPAAAHINILEQGQFVKYDYANEEVNFTGPGEWMLVFNEIKLYRENQLDCEFAMIKDNYQARVYSPFGGYKNDDGTMSPDVAWTKQSRWYNGKDSDNNSSITLGASPARYEVATSYDSNATYYTDNTGATEASVADADAFAAGTFYIKTADEVAGTTYAYDDVTAGLDYYEMHYNEDPFHIESRYTEKKMPAGTQMVPRVFKTNVGDIFTTNMLGDASYTVGDPLVVGKKGILQKGSAVASATGQSDPLDDFAGSGDMRWQVVKVYTMPDHQPGVKVMRIA